MDAPLDPALLLDLTRCPACFEPLRGRQCLRCGLDVSVDGGIEVYAASQAVAQAIRTRDAAIAGMRARQAERSAAATLTVAAPSMIPPPSPPVPAPAAPEGPRRSGVQILLLVAGVSAVSVAAVFFALVAVLLASPTIRAAILAVVGAGVLGGAVALRRRLPATAEAVTVVGLVVLLLDLLLLRISDVAGLGGTDPLVYAGAGLGVVAGAGALLGGRAGLRAGSFAAVFLLPAAALLVVAGLAEGADGTTAAWAGALAATVVASAAGLAVRRAEESAALRSQALLAALAAMAASAAALDGPLLRLVTEGAVAAAAAGHLVLARRRRPHGVGIDVPAAAAVAAAAVSLALLLALGTGTRPLVSAVVLVPIALLVPLACAVVLLRQPGARTPALAGLLAAGAVGIPFPGLLLFSAGQALGPLLVAAAGTPFAADPGWATPASAAELAIAAGAAAALLAAAGRAARAPRLVAAGAVVLGLGALAVATAAGNAGALLAAGVAVGGLAVAALVLLSRRWAALASALIGVAATAIALAAPRSAALWPFAVAAGVVVLAAAAAAAGQGVIRAGVVAVLAAFLLLGASFAVPWARAIDWAVLAPAPVAGVPFVLAGLMLAASGLLRGRVPERERVAAAAAALLGALGAGTVLAVAAPPGAAAAAAIGLAAAAAGAVALARHPGGAADVEPVLAAALGPVLLSGTAAAAAVQGAPALLVPLAWAVGVLAAAALAIGRVAGTGPVRHAWRSSTGAAAIVAVVVDGATGPPEAWIPVLLLAVAALVLAVGDPSRAFRLTATWCAYALGIATLWQALGSRAVDAVEAYTLPPALVLLGAAAVAAVRRPAAPGRGRNALAAAGLTLALVPSALASWTSDGARAPVVAIVAGALVVAALRVPRSVRSVATGPVLLGVAAPVLATVALAQSIRSSGAGFEAWAAPAGVLLLGAALVLTRVGRVRAAGVPLAAGSVLVASWTVLAAGADGATLRLPVPLLLLAAAYLLLTLWSPVSPPLTARLAATPIVAGGIAAAVAAVVVRASAPIEAATLPIAAGLLATGALRMRRDPAVRSWPALGPGLAVLLLPSLVLDVQPAVTWRVVALGVVALAVLVLGTVTRLSAPFLLGGTVFVVHVVAQLQPWIAQVYVTVPWWAWIGAGGVLLIALAARYERRVRDLKQAVRLLSAQR